MKVHKRPLCLLAEGSYHSEILWLMKQNSVHIYLLSMLISFFIHWFLEHATGGHLRSCWSRGREWTAKLIKDSEILQWCRRNKRFPLPLLVTTGDAKDKEIELVLNYHLLPIKCQGFLQRTQGDFHEWYNLCHLGWTDPNLFLFSIHMIFKNCE